MAESPGELHADLSRLAKVDLHRHLEGSLRLETVRELAVEGRIPLPRDPSRLARKISIQPDEARTPQAFLSKFEAIREVFQSTEIVKRAAFEAVEDAAQDGVRYLELHASPSALTAATGADFGLMLDVVWEGVLEASAENDIEVRLVASVNRHEGLNIAVGVAEAAAERLDRGVVALDLAGDESINLGREFLTVFHRAKQNGLKLSAHAGEWAGPESVRFAIEDMGADRIAHGVRVLEEKDVALMARDQGIPFLVCITSNVQSGVVDRLESHPLPAMIQAGLQVSINTDDPSLSGISLSDEYRLAVETMNLSVESLKGLILAATQAAFLPEAERRTLGKRLQRILGLAPEAPGDRATAS